MHLTSNEIALFIFCIAIMLFSARLLGELFRKIKQPVVIGEIIAGILLGRTGLGLISPEFYNYLFNSSQLVEITLQGFVEIAIIMLMIVSGLEVDLSIVLTQGKKATLISIFSIILPFSLGFLAAYFFPGIFENYDEAKKIYFSLFIGTALSVTALPIIVRLLIELKIFKTEIGTIIITAAMFTDLFGWIFFSFIISSFKPHVNSNNILNQIIIILSFILIVILVGRKIFSSIIIFLEKHTISKGAVISFIFIIGFLGAAFTQYIGIHAILGAFIIGIAVGDSIHLKEETREIVQQFATNIFAPIFFVSIGLKINFIQNFSLEIFFLLLFLSFIGKVLGSFIGSFLGGINKNDSLIIGFGMNSYGVMQIVLSLIAFQIGLINNKIFVSLVMLSIVTSLISAPLMSIFIKRAKRKISFIDLIDEDLILFSDKKNKKEVIEELSLKVSQYYKIDFDLIYSNVMKREEQISTGLANYLALPHAKIKIANPIIAIAISKDGIDFNSFDGKKSKIIILLLTPEEKPEIQLILIREIAKFFVKIEISEKIINIQEKNIVINTIKELIKGNDE